MSETTRSLTDQLEALDEAALRDLIARAGELLRTRERAKQQEALERARSILEEAGLSVQDLMQGPRSRPARKPSAAASPRKAVRYANPANPAQIYERGRGRVPNWFRALSESGQTPAPLED